MASAPDHVTIRVRCAPLATCALVALVAGAAALGAGVALFASAPGGTCVGADGARVPVGTAVPGEGDDWCNTCRYLDDCALACTRMACPPERCDGDLVWDACASACPATCDRPAPDVCVLMCVPTCACPRGTTRVSTASTACVERCAALSP